MRKEMRRVIGTRNVFCAVIKYTAELETVAHVRWTANKCRMESVIATMEKYARIESHSLSSNLLIYARFVVEGRVNRNREVHYSYSQVIAKE